VARGVTSINELKEKERKQSGKRRVKHKSSKERQRKEEE
jgi:hypothetical protein